MHATRGDEAVPLTFQRTPLPSSHPLVGVWQVDIAKTVLKPPPGYDGNCVEQYTIKVDGTKTSASGEERNESEFMITRVSRDSYWYKWVDKITANNGKPDCTGARTAVGHMAVNYLILHPSGERFALCEKESMNSCYVELFRKGR
jgi:hypothetical protein